MRFYYVSIFSVIFLGLIYAVGTALLVGLWYALRRWKSAWMLMLPLFVLLYIGPIAEELWISWNFGQLCKKDAGIFVYKTVKVEGFYDDTHSWTARRMREEPGYRFLEGRGDKSGKAIYWRHERAGDQIRSFTIDHPTARYHYIRPDSHRPVQHKIERNSREVIDSQTGEVLAKEVSYGREPPWFFIHLDRPVMLCPEPGQHPLSRYGSVYNLALKPIDAR